MSRRTAGAQPALAGVAALTSLVTLWSWGSFQERPDDYFGTLVFGLMVLTGAGMATRALRFPVVVTVAAQLLVLMLLANLVWGSGVLPTPDSVRTTLSALLDAVESARTFAAPVPQSAATTAPLLVLGALACHLLVDLTAVTLGRVPLAGLPLLTVYSLPVSVLDRPISWVYFALGAAGFLGMLVLQERDRVIRWGRSLDGYTDWTAIGGRTGSTPTTAVSATAITLGVLLPLMIPTLDLSVFDRGDGQGTGGDRRIKITNPLADLRRDLVQPENVALLQARTDNRNPSYLRISVLSLYTGETWTPGGRDLDEGQELDGEIPVPTGLDDSVPRTEERWELSATERLESRWLPAPRYVTAVEAGDEWRYDAETLDFHVADNDDDSAGLDYSLTALDLDLDPRAMADAAAAPGELTSEYTRLPEDFPASVEQLAEDVAGDAPTDFEKAVALQAFFQDNFTYSTDIQPGNGSSDLVQFLSEGDRKGYCEQFAAAMAVMARSLDVPARVSVGLLDGKRVQGTRDQWVFGSRDMHAWPEIYLEGFGWVMFEPTPTQHTKRLPSYSRGIGPDEAPSVAPSSSGPSAGPSSASPRPTRSDPGAQSADTAQDDDRDRNVLLPSLFGGGGTLLLLGALALVPRTVRRRRTANRWRSGDPAEAGWAELRDVAVDLAVPWPTGRSPRAGAHRLALHFGAPLSDDTPERPAKGPRENPVATEAVQRLATLLEENRYAPPGGPAADLDEVRELVATCTAALRGGATRRARRRADWWPRSVVQRGATGIARPVISRRPTQGVVDNLG